MGQMPGMETGSMKMNMGPLLSMSGNEMSIRVGSSETNLMSMGAMGSGTSWQPSSAPMHMHYKVAGDWLLMFHYNVFIDINHQGGPRGGHVGQADDADVVDGVPHQPQCAAHHPQGPQPGDHGQDQQQQPRE